MKAYEYNADSASCYMESGFVHNRWAEHFHCATGYNPAEHLFDALTNAWKRSGVDSVLHIMQDRDIEETYHALFMKEAIEKTGIPCKIIKGQSSLTWDDQGWVCDADGVRIQWVWKTWA